MKLSSTSARFAPVALVAALSLLATGCFNFDEAVQKCLADGDCQAASGPTLKDTTPANLEKDVEPSNAISLTFSEPMAKESVELVNSPDFKVGTPLWNDTATEVTFTPSAPLAVSTQYTVRVLGTAASGKKLGNNASFGFTTRGPPDLTAPNLLLTDPLSGAQNVSRTAKFTFTFSEPMNPAALELQFSPGFDPGTPTWNGANTLVSFNAPPAKLDDATDYLLVVDAKDKAGNALAGARTVAFKTVAEAPPTVVSSSPPQGATAVSPNTKVSIAFSKPMTATGLIGSNPAALAMSGPDGGNLGINCVIDNARTSVICDRPTKPALDPGEHRFTVNTAARDLEGNPMQAGFLLGFNSSGVQDTVKPTLTRYTPDSGATLFPCEAVTLSFSEVMDKYTVQQAFAFVSPVNDGGIFTWAADGGPTVSVKAAQTFTPGATVNWRIGNAAADLSGNTLPLTVQDSFKLMKQGSLNVPVSTDGTTYATNTYESDPSRIWAGDSSTNATWRAHLSFNLSALPAGAVLKSARLNLYQATTFGDAYDATGFIAVNPPPPPALGYLKVERTSWSTFTGSVSSTPAQSSPKVCVPCGVCTVGSVNPSTTADGISFDETLGWKDVNVLNMVAAAQSAGNVQFRVFFTRATNNDDGSDYAGFFSSKSTGSTSGCTASNGRSDCRPYLALEYFFP